MNDGQLKRRMLEADDLAPLAACQVPIQFMQSATLCQRYRVLTLKVHSGHTCSAVFDSGCCAANPTHSPHYFACTALVQP